MNEVLKRVKIISLENFYRLSNDVIVKTAILKFVNEDPYVSEEIMFKKVMNEIRGSVDPKYVKNCIAEIYNKHSMPI